MAVTGKVGSGTRKAEPKCIAMKDFEGTRGGPPNTGRGAGRPYNRGIEPTQVSLKVVPHYRLWNPDEPEDSTLEDDAGDEVVSEVVNPSSLDDPPPSPESDARMPYESRHEPLSRKAWVEQFRQNAPRMQHVVDTMRKQLEEKWSKGGQFNACWSEQKSGSDTSGKLEKFKSVIQTCQEMRDTAETIRGKRKEYDIRFFSNSCGHNSRSGSCGCVRVFNTEAADVKPSASGDEPDCQALNCYDNDQSVQDALGKLRQKNEKCRRKVAAELAGEAKSKAASSGSLLCIAVMEIHNKPSSRRRGARRTFGPAALRSFLELRPV